jgi:phosphoribosylanthranilate isomerase
MISKTILVKGISSLSEARYCAGMFVDFISFDFNLDSEDFVNKAQFDEIRAWLSGVKILGTLNSKDTFDITDCIQSNNLDGFLFAENQIAMMSEVSVPFKAVELESISKISLIENGSLIIYTGKYEPKLMDSLESDNLLLLGYGFDNLKIDHDRIKGYAFTGSKEKQPGVNNYDELMDAFDFLDR